MKVVVRGGSSRTGCRAIAFVLIPMRLGGERTFSSSTVVLLSKSDVTGSRVVRATAGLGSFTASKPSWRKVPMVYKREQQEGQSPMGPDVSRRSVLGVAGVAAATLGAGVALSACSINEGSSAEEDSSTMLGRAPQQNPLKGKVLFHDNFDDGFNGWRDHYGGAGPIPALSLTSYPVFSGSHALMIGCAAAPDDGYEDKWVPGFGVAAFKNLSRYYDSNLVTFSCYLTHGSDESTASLGGYGLMIDTQFWDNSRRSFFDLQINRNTSSGDRSLSVKDNSGKRINVYQGSGLMAGDNENKFNFDWLSLTVDLDANGGSGGYHSCQVNNQTFDLTKANAGSANEPPQKGSSMLSFAGGLNFGVQIFPGGPGTGESFLVVDQAIATVNEVSA